MLTALKRHQLRSAASVKDKEITDECHVVTEDHRDVAVQELQGRERQDFTALVLSCKNGHELSAPALLEAGAEVEKALQPWEKGRLEELRELEAEDAAKAKRAS